MASDRSNTDQRSSDESDTVFTPPQWAHRWINRLHVKVYQLSSGRLGARLADAPVALVRTMGRRTGNPHTVAMPVIELGDDIVAVAAYGEQRHSPAWFLNIRANPDVVVQRGNRAYWASSQTLDADERTEAQAAIAAVSANLARLAGDDAPIVRFSYRRPFTG